MPPDAALVRAPVQGIATRWRASLCRLALAWAVLAVATFGQWRAMAHQWWDIDTYNHVLLVPPILAWIAWLRRPQLAKVQPIAWWPGLGVVAPALLVALGGIVTGLNLVAQLGSVAAMIGAVVALLGIRVSLLLRFPLCFALFLVPFGDELIPALQHVTAWMTVQLAHLSGVPAGLHGLFIDTPAGRFVVAQECSGVKFLIAMVALAVLVGWTGFARWRRRVVLVLGAALASIAANGVRAWGTIFAAQYVGIERAGGIDHIVYGWVFFAIVIALVLGVASRFLEREPANAGLTADEVARHPLAPLERLAIAPDAALLAIAAMALAFAAVSRLI